MATWLRKRTQNHQLFRAITYLRSWRNKTISILNSNSRTPEMQQHKKVSEMKKHKRKGIEMFVASNTSFVLLKIHRGNWRRSHIISRFWRSFEKLLSMIDYTLKLERKTKTKIETPFSEYICECDNDYLFFFL